MITSLIDNLFNRFLTKDEAVPLYGYVGRKPSSPDDRSPKIPQPSVERDVNALIPVLSFKLGSETHSFTIQDLIRKAEVLGVSKDTSSWLYSQGNNYAPPINFDRFTNFFNYYWFAKALPNAPVHEWNPSLAPEYYVIARPDLSDDTKLNVVTASIAPINLTGTGFYPQTWSVEFLSANDARFNPTTDVEGRTFIVIANGAGIAPEDATKKFTLDEVTEEATTSFQVHFTVPGAAAPLLSFKILRDPIYDSNGVWIGNESFEAGDNFTIAAPFLSSTYNVTVVQASPGVKGKIAGVDSLDVYQTIGGVQVKENDRILVTGNGFDNGIYVVKPGAFVRAADYDEENIKANATVFVTKGDFAGYTFTSSQTNNWVGVANTTTNTNDWQEANYWIHRDEASALGFDTTKLVQATRPIIEFNANVQLNSQYKVQSTGVVTLARSAAVTSGNLLRGVPTTTPTDVGGVSYVQRKTEFNQAPLFDLFRYDGTHTGQVTPLFFYVEDPTADIDPALQRRVKRATNESGDFIFGHGLVEGDSQLFYKLRDGTLHGIWHAGFSNATVSDVKYVGEGDVQASFEILDPFASQQVWTFTATGPFTFSVSGSKIKDLPEQYRTIVIGTEYNNGIFKALLTGTAAVGDTVYVRVGNFETTRYVYRSEDDFAVYDVFGGAQADADGKGAWQVPRMFYNNVEAKNGGEIPEGTLYSHFRGILQNQVAGLPENRAFGGSVKLWSEQQNLLASLLMQRDLTPVSMIDLAQRQYESALNSITDIFSKELVNYFSDNEVVVNGDDVDQLVDYILSIRAKDNDVRTVLYDSTSPVVGFPATLPMLGVIPAVKPEVVFDNELGATLFKHHDGHLSPLATFTQEFKDRLLSPSMLVKRSDGSYTPAVGSFTNSPPANPYKGELWMSPLSDGSQVLRVFNVLSDTTVAPETNIVGAHWYNRLSNTLKVWNGAFWADETNPLGAWVEIDPAQILNQVLFTIETRLYDGINKESRTYFTKSEIDNWVNSKFAPYLHRELASWAATNGYDPLAPDYKLSDPFTWNYSSVGLPARWFNALKQHQASVAGVIPTARPNLEPWKLLGFADKPADWDSTWAAQTISPDELENVSQLTRVRTIVYSDVAVGTTLYGLPTSPIDGCILRSGDRILLVSETVPQNNGIWIVRSGGWERANDPLNAGLVVVINEGTDLSGTAWQLMADKTDNSQPAVFEQVRWWKRSMWAHIKSQRQNLKLSIDVNRDILIPPYVSDFFAASQEALTTVEPSAKENPYLFGEGSLVETVWTKSLEFNYSLARALFRADPLGFLGHCWGFQWVEVDNILYDSADITVPGHRRFRLHGDPVDSVVRKNPITFGSVVTGPTEVFITITCDGFTSSRKQSFSVRTESGKLLGYLHEGSGFESINSSGYSLNAFIEDEGIPFRIGDKFIVKAQSNGNGMTCVLEQTPYFKFNGFGQTFAQALRDGSVDGSQGYAMRAFKGWDVNLGYRAGGLVSTDDLRVFSDSDAIPESAYELRFKRSPYAKDLWVQGLRVSVVQLGDNVPAESGYAPKNDAADWAFRIEGYNSRYLGIEYFELDANGEYQTFNALSKSHSALEWKQYTEIKSLKKTELPLTIIGLQNVVTFLYGYSKKLEEDGWRFQDDNGGNIDIITGRVRNWQLEIEKLIDAVYAGIDLGQGHVLVPFMDRVWIEQDTGLLSPFYDTALFDVTGHPGVFDTLGSKIPTEDLTILRSRGKSMISAAVPMFSVHAQMDEYEHLFVFNNLTSPSTGEGLIYDPFSGARIVTIKLNGRRQAAQTLRPEFGGHYLVGDQVKRNLQSSTDKIANYYDAGHVFEDKLSTRHALALLGFSPKQYMTDLDLNDSTQFNFWRGLIQMKGTNASIDSFLNNGRFEDAKLDEYWAYKVAEYGDSRSKVFPELRLSVDDTLQQFTKLQFKPTEFYGDTVYNNLEQYGFKQIDMLDENRWFSIDDLGADRSFESQVVGRYERIFTNADVFPQQIKLSFVCDELDYAIDEVMGDSAKLRKLNNTTLEVYGAGVVEAIGYGPATPKFNPVKLFNYVDVQLVEEIPVWHPAAGAHTPSALESINIISSTDPARYNVSTQVVGNANYDPLRTWGAKEVGRVWFDTTSLDYVPYYDKTVFTDVDGRLSRWGTLADYASVDVVEWVESSVPPSEYDALAAQDAGNADLIAASKADGQAYGAKTYSRERVWKVRPIAWSKAAVATERAHPSFNASLPVTLRAIISGDIQNGLMYLDEYTFAALGISAGMRIGGWVEDEVSARPVSEYLVTDEFTKHITPNSSTINNGTVSISVFKHTPVVGTLIASSTTNTSYVLDDEGIPTSVVDYYETTVTVEQTQTGLVDVIVVRYTEEQWSTPTSSYDLPNLGLRVTHSPMIFDVTDTENNFGAVMEQALTGVDLKDAVRVQAIVVGTEYTTFSNDGDDSTIGWRAWNVPTQEDLDSDSRVPNSAWLPYAGDFVEVNTPSVDLIMDAAAGASYTLNDGTVIDRYSTDWTNWEEIKSVLVRKTASETAVLNTTDPMTIEIPRATSDRVSVYVNGVAQLAGTFSLANGKSINDDDITIVSIPSIQTGAEAVVIVRAYIPSQDELAFDPSVEDNVKIQRQFKVDYQYVAIPIRGEDGSFTTTKYFFWVKNRSVAARSKNLSVKAITQLITTGPSQYLTFQNIHEETHGNQTT